MMQGPGFIPGQGIDPTAAAETSRATTKTRCSQINKYEEKKTG